MTNLLRKLLNIVFGLIFTFVYTQELPPINSFSPKQYNADNQNWSISQTTDKHIYFANNKGLLEFNGSKWHLYNSPNESIIRSVKAIGNKIYTGCYMDFGFWERNDSGFLNYTSLSKDLNVPLVEDEQFWNIINLDEWIIFQSLNRIYIYNHKSKEFSFIESKTKLTKAFLVNESVYYQKLSDGIYKIENGKEKLVYQNQVVKDNPVVDIFWNNNKILIVTQSKGLYFDNKGNLEKWHTNADKILDNASVYSSIKLKNNTYALGTISHGVIIINPEGSIVYQIEQQKGLRNNTVLSLFEDLDENIWLGLDNGINCINMSSPYRIYKDVIGELGTVYTSAVVDSMVYLGTNQGLFYKKLDSKDKFKAIKNLKGQVWNLIKINGNLFCGHDIGTYIIEGKLAKKISNVDGTWDIIPIPNNENLLLQGNYSGFHVLEKKNGLWTYRNKIKGFDMSSRYFQFIDDDDVLVSHEYKGVFKIKLNSELTKVINLNKDNSVSKGLNSSLIKYKENVYYSYKNGIYKYNKSTNIFKKDSVLSSVLDTTNYTSGKLLVDNGTDKLWSFSKNHITYISPGKISNTPEINRINLPDFLRNSIVGFENITHLNNGQFLIGSSDGYLIIDLNQKFNKQIEVKINSVSSRKISKNPTFLNLSELGNLKNKENNVEISFSASEFDMYSQVEYQHKLEGLYNNWSNWSTSPTILYDNLPYGSYTFKVRGKVGNKISNNIATYSFNIDRPWWLSNFMIAFYVLLFIIGAMLIHVLYKRYYKKQRKKLLLKSQQELELKELENQQQLMQFKNEKLEQDIKSKNRELAISTMSLIKKNEFLNEIKSELKNISLSNNVKPVMELINSEINNTDDWKFFEEAFNNADKDFLKKVKSIHPNLTSNDLRLCAYLRLNLSSKEIAPLLNISPKSVEVKRYRLRKKMNLTHETSLTNYILEI